MAINLRPALRPKSTAKTASSSTSAQSAAIADNIFYVRIAVDAISYLEFGVNPTATTSSLYMAAGASEIFKVAPGEKIAVITASTGNMWMSLLTE